MHTCAAWLRSFVLMKAILCTCMTHELLLQVLRCPGTAAEAPAPAPAWPCSAGNGAGRWSQTLWPCEMHMEPYAHPWLRLVGCKWRGQEVVEVHLPLPAQLQCPLKSPQRR